MCELDACRNPEVLNWAPATGVALTAHIIKSAVTARHLNGVRLMNEFVT